MIYKNFDSDFRSNPLSSVYEPASFYVVDSDTRAGNTQIVHTSTVAHYQIHSDTRLIINTVLENGQNNGLVSIAIGEYTSGKGQFWGRSLITARQTGFESFQGITFVDSLNFGGNTIFNRTYYLSYTNPYLSSSNPVTAGQSYTLYNDGSHGDFPVRTRLISGLSGKLVEPFQPFAFTYPLNSVDGSYRTSNHIVAQLGSDAVSYASAAGGVVIDLSNRATWDGVSNDTLSGFENAIGSSFNDVIVGDAENNVFDGHGGSDTITGGGGNDTISFASAAGRQVIDLSNRATWDYGVHGHTLASIENAIGSSFNDLIVGDAGNNVFDGHGGSDTITGGGGSDTISFASATGPQVIDLGAQATWDYEVNGHTLSGIKNAIGSEFNDIIMSTDVREGSPGGALTGGGGADIFYFTAVFGHQAITDFVTGGPDRDTIKLAHGLFANDDPLAAAVDYGNDVLLTAPGQGTILLMGVHKADLTAANFDFGEFH